MKKNFKSGFIQKCRLRTITFLRTRITEAGAKNILLSLGSEGALFMNNEKVLSGNSPTGMVVNTACSGDAMLGTF